MQYRQEGSSRQAELGPARLRQVGKGTVGMKRSVTKAVAMTAALLATGSVASAKADTPSTTAYTYYAVSGRTPGEIYAALLRRGPTVQGTKALAVTTADAVERHTMLQTSSSCQIVDYRVTFRFVVNLPSIPNEYVLPPQDRQLWQQFSVFLKTHELHHIKLWLACASNLEAQVRGLHVSTCEDLSRRADAMWKDMRASCSQDQADFDTEQRTELLQQPFMRKVISGAGR